MGNLNLLEFTMIFEDKGKGIKVINHLIDVANKLGIKRLSIETGAGEFFAPARKLFKNSGFNHVNHLLTIKTILTLFI